MRKIFFIAVMLLSMSVTAQQRTFTKSVNVNYATKQVTFKISWAAGSRGVSGASTYHSKVWVWVDYQEVQNNNPYGDWKRADIDLSKLPANCTADGTNTKGFWYQGQATAAQDATITITLTGVPPQFKWCAFASDCPPSVVINTNQDGSFKGTSPFTLTYTDGTMGMVNLKGNVRIPDGKPVQSIRDATTCPGSISYTYTGCATSAVNLGAVGFASTQTWVVGAQTWSAPVTATYCNKTAYSAGADNGPYSADCRKGGDAASTNYHFFSWCMVVQYASQLCPSPWRGPTKDEFCLLDKTLNNRSDCPYYRDSAVELARYVSDWGAQYLGYIDATYYFQYSAFPVGWYYTISEANNSTGYIQYLVTSGGTRIYPGGYTGFAKNRGLVLRCVK